MKIIGGRDYYDNGMVYPDHRNTFVRHGSKLPKNDVKVLPRNNENFDAVTVLFCGTVYGGLRINNQIHWSKDTALAARQVTLDRLYAKMPKRYWNTWPDTTDSDLDKLFTPSVIYRNYAIDNGITIATCVTRNHCLLEDWVIDGSDLRRFEFFRIKPAFEAYQEIEQWISGVLTDRGKTPPQIVDEKIRIAKRGFDPIWSFRKEPTKGR